MRLIFFEFKKMIFKPILLVLLGVFSIINVYVLSVNSDDFAPFSSFKPAEKVYNDVCDKVEGKMTDEKINYVIDKYEETAAKISGDFSTEFDPSVSYTGYLQSDFNVFCEIYESMKTAYHYEDNTVQLIEKANENVAFFSENGYPQQAEKYEKMISVYENRSIKAFYRTDGFEALFAHDLSSLLIILLLIFAISDLLTSECELGMISLILPSKKGINGIIFPRLFAAVLLCISLVTWFTVIDIATVSVTNGLHGWTNPLYSLPSYAFSAANYSIAAHIVFVAVMKIIGLCTIAFFIISVSAVLPSSVMSFSANFVTVLSLILLNDKAEVGGVSSLFNPISMFTVQDSFKSYITTDIFGQNMMSYNVCLFVGIIMCLTMLFVYVITMRASSAKIWRHTK